MHRYYTCICSGLRVPSFIVTSEMMACITHSSTSDANPRFSPYRGVHLATQSSQVTCTPVVSPIVHRVVLSSHATNPPPCTRLRCACVVAQRAASQAGSSYASSYYPKHHNLPEMATGVGEIVTTARPCTRYRDEG